jgi:hypothetical protein
MIPVGILNRRMNKMSVSFSTICKAQAEKYFADPAWNWLPDAGKEYVLELISKGTQEARVQDPLMYPSPSIEFHGKDAMTHNDRLMELIASEKNDTEASK